LAQETLAPLDSTRAARLAMARKILFDMCVPPSSRLRAEVLAVGLWSGSLRSMDTARRRRSRVVPGSRFEPVMMVVRVMRIVQWFWKAVRSTSPAHRSLCSCQCVSRASLDQGLLMKAQGSRQTYPSVIARARYATIHSKSRAVQASSSPEATRTTVPTSAVPGGTPVTVRSNASRSASRWTCSGTRTS